MNLNNIFVIPTNVLETSSGNSTLSQRGSNIMNNEKVSGIYKIINKVNWKYYVGSGKDLIGHGRSRKAKHFSMLRNNIHFNSHLQRAWNKYGKDNFEFVVIEKDISEDQLFVVEQRYLDIAKTEQDKCYNQCFGTEKRNFSDETRRKMSAWKRSKGKDNPLFIDIDSDIDQKTKNELKDYWIKHGSWALFKFVKPTLGFGHRTVDKLIKQFRLDTYALEQRNINYAQTSKIRAKSIGLGKLVKGKLTQEGLEIISKMNKGIPKNKKIFTFFNIKTKETFIGTCLALRTAYPYIRQGNLASVISDKSPRKNVNNWIVIRNPESQ